MEKRILIIGYFGYKTNQLDGQTIKTRNIYNLLVKNYRYVDFFDSQSIKKEFFQLIYKVIKNDYLIYLPGSNNLTYIFPLIFILSKIRRSKIIYPVVGGWLDLFLKKHPFHLFLLRNIYAILSESSNLDNNLINNFNLKNTSILPNFRDNCYLTPPNNKSSFNIVFMARICEEKGINVVFRFAEYIIKNNLVNPQYPIKITFYGNLDSLQDHQSFFSNIKKFPFITYEGIVNPEDVYSKLIDQDILVLPTHYSGEGLPGSIIEAYIAGIPVVVSNWRFLPEFVEHGETGYIYDLDKEEDFYSFILYLYNNADKLSYMKNKAKIRGYKYTSEYALEILKKYII